MIFEGKDDWRQVSQGLVRPLEIVFNEPFSQIPIKLYHIFGHVSQSDEFILQGAVESFGDRIVLGRLDPRPIMINAQRVARGFKMMMELRPIVGLDILNPAVKQEMEPVQEIPGGIRTVSVVHPGKSYLGVPVNGCQDVPFLAAAVFDDSIKAQEKAGARLALQFRDLPSGFGSSSFSVNSSLFSRFIVQTGGLNNALNLPGGNSTILGIFPVIYIQELHLAIAQILLPQGDHIGILPGSVFPFPHAMRSPRSVDEAFQKILVKPVPPFVEGLPGDAEMAAGQRRVFMVLLVENHPFQAASGGPGETEQQSHPPPSVVAIPKLVAAVKISSLERRPKPFSGIFRNC